MGGLYCGGVSGRRDRSHGENGRHTPESDRSAERCRSPSYDSYDRREPDRRGRSPSPSYDHYDDHRDSSSQRPRRRVSPRDPDSRGALGPMADQEEDLKMALRLSMQHSPPEPKRSKPRDTAAAAGGFSPEDGRRMQMELVAAAAEKRMLAARSAGAASPAPSPSQSPSV
ncbi:hypothetical protein NL676_014678 [Syzygium grande]|nr:hypothetical protein NL676_014678 [Syzygium grande]